MEKKQQNYCKPSTETSEARDDGGEGKTINIWNFIIINLVKVSDIFVIFTINYKLKLSRK